jgi:hypothetical protein
MLAWMSLPVLTSRKDPDPSVIFISPGRKHPRPYTEAD